MIRGIKSLGVRLWLTVLAAVPICFFIMPRMIRMGMEAPAVIPAALIMGIIFVLIHLVFDLLGRRLIHSLLEEARAWERAGLSPKAGRAYTKAAGIYDSFLLSPWAAGRISQGITGSLARFALTCEPDNPAFYGATQAHLRQFPEDETLAQLFLEQILRRGRAGRAEEDIITRMAEAHHGHRRLGPVLADILLDLGREDFAARKVFKSVLELPQVGEERKQRILELERESEMTLGQAAGRQNNIERVPGGQGMAKTILSGAGRVFGMVFNGVMISLLAIMQGLHRGSVFVGKGLYRLWRGEHTARYLKWGVVGIFGLGLVYFAGSTMVHLVKTGAWESSGGAVVKKMPKPFTIQVAAYLKQKHADRFVNQLKEKGVTAVVKKVGGGGKTWYLVRVSEFTDKASATAYGKQLKARKIIDDFFVSNK